MGKIFLPAYKDEEAALVTGIHEPIIGEGLYYAVQDVLDGKKRTMPSTCSAKEELPLRGFLACPACGNNLTGSGSKGNGGKYFYYHCNSTCGVRFKAVDANETLLQELERISVNGPSILLFEEIVKSQSRHTGKERNGQQRETEAIIAKNQQRIAAAQQMMVDGEITAADYREIKGRYEPEIRQLQQALEGINQLAQKLNSHITAATDLLRNLRLYYIAAALPVKQKLIGSMFPEKLVFEKKNYRTIKLHPTVALICRPSAGFGEKRKGLTSKNRSQPYPVYRTQFHIGGTYGISESAVCRTIQRIEDVLQHIKELKLPGKKQLSTSGVQYKVILIDATEMPVERPKKSSSFIIRAKRNGTPSKCS